MSSISRYDPNAIIRAANDKLAANDLEGGKMVFQSALLDWVDDAREGFPPEPSLQEAIATLWLAYAHFLAKTKQFKSTTETYEEAVQSPVTRTVGRVWLEYARFLEERQKFKSAQDVYIRALVGTSGNDAAVLDEQDRDLLWAEFLEMMRKSNPELTLRELQAVVTDHREARDPGGDNTSTMEVVASAPILEGHSESLAMPPTKRMRTRGTDNALAPEPLRTHVVTAEGVDLEANAFLDTIQQVALPQEIHAAWLIRDGIGIAQQPEPPLFRPAPPKLSNPTATDILGIDLSLSLIERLVSPSGSLLLEVCRGLWTWHALREKQANQAIEMLDKTMLTEMDRLENNLEARLSVAGAARSAIESMNANERMSFQNACSQQRQNLLSGIAWEFRLLLYTQQQILTKLAVPGFEGPTVDAAAIDLQARICSFLHSAFYLRNRIGEEQHVNMLNSQLKRLRREKEQAPGTISPVPPQFTTTFSPPQPNFSYAPQLFQPIIGMPTPAPVPEYGSYPGQVPPMQSGPPPGQYGAPPAFNQFYYQ